MRILRLGTAIPLATIALLLVLEPAYAQPAATRVFEGLSPIEVDGAPGVRVSFSTPVRYLRHTPQATGNSINVQFFPLNVSEAGAPAFFHRESLRVPSDIELPIAAVVYDGITVGRPTLEVRLDRTAAFEVQQGDDLRSIVIVFPLETNAAQAAATPTAPRPPGGSTLSSDRVAEMMAEGRRAMTAGEYDRAALIFTKVVSHADGAAALDAQELLGLARERKGQLAHAKAEYEAYLAQSPDGEGAKRVRQRLDALITARVERPPPSTPDPPEVKPMDFSTFGSTYVGYRRQSLYPRSGPVQLADSSLFTDVHLEARFRTDRYTLRSQWSGGYQYDFLDGGSDETRINSLFVEAEDHPHRLKGFIGRRSLSSAGVLGRFDGLRATYGLNERMEMGVTGGFPVDSGRRNTVQTDVAFVGMDFEVAQIAESVNAQIYAIGQMDRGAIDRMAIGTEIHYFDQGRFAAAFIDYDVYFQELNLAQLIGNWQVTPSTLLTTYLAYRRVPALTAQNALTGQRADDVRELEDDYSRSEIKQLARDRTARSTTLTFGVNHFLTSDIQLSADFTAADYSGTRASGDVDAIEGSGFEFTYSTQLVWNDFIRDSGIGIVGLRYYDGSDYDFLTASIDGRYPITRDLRMNPRLRVNYRSGSFGGDVVSVIPSLRFDYGFWNMNFDAEVGGEWLLPVDSSSGDERLGYSISFGLRYDF